jgi:hypothetical protein
MGDRKCNVLKKIGTDGLDEKHGLQRTLVIVQKTSARIRYIC